MSCFAQHIEWETNYLHATAKAKKANKLLVVYFSDGTDIEKENIIEQTVINSEVFNKQGHHFIFLKLMKQIQSHCHPIKRHVIT